MAVASPRLFLALCLSFPLRLCVPPCLSPRVFTHRSHRTLRPSSCTESVPHTTYAHVYTPTHTYTYIHLHVHTHTYTHTRAKCIPCFRSLCVPSFDPSSSSSSSSSSSCSFFPPVRSSHELRATAYVCPDLKIVRLVPGRSP